ncbi:hypothetical protein PA598K_06566 [Paenibacillus sp. 598K]|uniref:hypothetical protein n=1 Tax=Paenibacillus sp. 598K TaxID=1117987 RepID=UPI000FFAD1B7|nr:hypothetical protein [Paenibacillus sp. 598K]GBF77978.1 hypothetical protein PA598K_06566 [Paenibacillus sp. 598K]
MKRHIEKVGRKAALLLLAGMLLSMLSVGFAAADTLVVGGSACGAGPHTLTPVANGPVELSYYGDLGSYATVYMYGSPYMNIYNGGTQVIYAALGSTLTITIQGGSGCVYAQ